MFLLLVGGTFAMDDYTAALHIGITFSLNMLVQCITQQVHMILYHLKIRLDLNIVCPDVYNMNT